MASALDYGFESDIMDFALKENIIFITMFLMKTGQFEQQPLVLHVAEMRLAISFGVTKHS